MGTLQFKEEQRAVREAALGQTFLGAPGSMGELESGLGVRRVKGVECILACKTEGEAFFRDWGILILFRLRKLGAVTPGGEQQQGDGHSSGWSRSLFPVSSLKELMKWKQRWEGDAGQEGEGGGHRSIYGRGAFALFSNPIENASEGQSKRKKSEWNVTTEKCHWCWSVESSLMWRDISTEWQSYTARRCSSSTFHPPPLHFSAPLTVEHSFPFQLRLSAGSISIPKMAPKHKWEMERYISLAAALQSTHFICQQPGFVCSYYILSIIVPSNTSAYNLVFCNV